MAYVSAATANNATVGNTPIAPRRCTALGPPSARNGARRAERAQIWRAPRARSKASTRGLSLESTHGGSKTAHLTYGETLGITAEGQDPNTTGLREPLQAFTKALRAYVLAVAAHADPDDTASIELTDTLLAPLQNWQSHIAEPAAPTHFGTALASQLSYSWRHESPSARQSSLKMRFSRRALRWPCDSLSASPNHTSREPSDT